MNDIQTERFGESVSSENRDGARSPYTPVVNTPTSSGSGCGCWAFGCAGVLIGGLLLVAGLGFGSYWFVTKQVEKYTDTEPEQIPTVEMDEEALQRLQDRIDSFSRQVNPGANDSTDENAAGEPGDNAELPFELILTADEINALIHANEALRGVAHIVIEEGHIQAKVSIPTDQIPGGTGRYFNADAEVEVSMENGILVVQLVDATVKGEPLPDVILGPMKEQNLAKEVYDDVHTAEVLRRFESIEVVDDAIILRLKRPDDSDAHDSIPNGANDVQAELEPALPLD